MKHVKQIIFIDGENFRQNLINILVEQKLLKNKNQMFKYNVRGLFEDMIGATDIAINY